MFPFHPVPFFVPRFPFCQLPDSLAFFDLARRLAGSLSFSTDKKWRTNNKEGIMTLRHIYGFISCPVLFSHSATTPARPSSRVSVSTLIRGEYCYKHTGTFLMDLWLMRPGNGVVPVEYKRESGWILKMNCLPTYQFSLPISCSLTLLSLCLSLRIQSIAFVLCCRQMSLGCNFVRFSRQSFLSDIERGRCIRRLIAFKRTFWNFSPIRQNIGMSLEKFWKNVGLLS